MEYAAGTVPAMAQNTVGPMVKEWRVRRRRSQLDLALQAGVSARHLSFVETGRSRPSPELVLLLADQLEVPLRERNDLLLAAGYAPKYPERSLDDASMTRVHTSLKRLLDAHDPYPGVVVDRAWNIVVANRAARALVVGLPADLLEPPLNVFRIGLHPNGLATRTLNLAEWATYLLSELDRTVVASGNDPGLVDLLHEVTSYSTVQDIARGCGSEVDVEPDLLIPLRLDIDGVELSMFTTMTRFSTPVDITLAELAVELFFPIDDPSDHFLRTTNLNHFE